MVPDFCVGAGACSGGAEGGGASDGLGWAATADAEAAAAFWEAAPL
jgi:hypothetical protein